MRKTALFLALLFLVSSTLLTPVANAQSKFKDVGESHWATKEIQFLTDKKVINGYKDGSFRPETPITRLQAVTMMLREKGISDFSNVVDPHFKDVPASHPGYGEIAKAVELGIVSGQVNAKGEKVFNPNGQLTRAQMAKILSLAYSLTATKETNFSDVPKSHWAYSYVQGLSGNNVTFGYGNGRFGPNDIINRVQFSVMMARTLDKSFRVAPTKPSEPTGKVYPDGWIAPVLKSKWSSSHATNLKTLQNELGFKNNGSTYGVTGRSEAVHVIGQAPSNPYEVDLLFYMWTDSAIPQSYRIPIVAKALFKLYFENDAKKVWNYSNNNDIPEHFTANGRKIDVSYDPNSGALRFKVGRK